MTPSKWFALPPPAPSRLPWLTMVTLLAACLIGAVMMSHFVDALHLSMARGEAFRTQQRLFGISDAAADQRQRVEALRLARSNP